MNEQKGYSTAPVPSDQKSLAEGNKELVQLLKSLDTSLKEIEQLQIKYDKLKKKLFSQAPDSGVVELKKKSLKEVQKMYTEIAGSLAKNEKNVILCMDKLKLIYNIEENIRKRKVEQEVEESPSKKQRLNKEVNLKIGQQVAARISKGKKDTPDDWILANITNFYPSKGKYEVEDADKEEENQPENRRYLLVKTAIIPLPDVEDPTNYEFPKETLVLAMFPNTTCFYKATVVGRRRKFHDYILKFADDEDESGTTPARRVSTRFVLPLPT